jgi:hypothetical protein
VANNARKTEHAGPKKGRGAYAGRRRDAKNESDKARRYADEIAIKDNLCEQFGSSIVGPEDARMQQMTKSQKRHLRDLAATAYDRELSAALSELHGHFARWQADEIDSWELNELIHKHHNGISRDIYSAYTGSNPVMPVARALVKRFLGWDEVREDCKPLLSSMVEYFSDEDNDASEA